jgi:hypothetical protein
MSPIQKARFRLLWGVLRSCLRLDSQRAIKDLWGSSYRTWHDLEPHRKP